MKNINQILNSIIHEVDLVCPQINYIKNPDCRAIYKGVLNGLRLNFSNTIPFPSRELTDREQSAAAEITFHLRRNNMRQVKDEVSDNLYFFNEYLEKYAENGKINKGDTDEVEF